MVSLSLVDFFISAKIIYILWHFLLMTSIIRSIGTLYETDYGDSIIFMCPEMSGGSFAKAVHERFKNKGEIP